LYLGRRRSLLIFFLCFTELVLAEHATADTTAAEEAATRGSAAASSSRLVLICLQLCGKAAYFRLLSLSVCRVALHDRLKQGAALGHVLCAVLDSVHVVL
jgi:hypothetical protein